MAPCRMRRILLATVSLALAVGLIAAGWWAYQNRVWLRDDYKDGYQAGEEYDRETRLQGCEEEVNDRFGVPVTISMPDKPPQRFGTTWSSIMIPAAPTCSSSFTVRITFIALP